MSDPIVYRSTDPSVLAAWESAMAATREYVRQTQMVLDQAGLGGRPIYCRVGSWDAGKFVGIGCDGGAPAGWRETTQGYAVPDKRYAAGRKVSEALKAVPFPGAPLQKLPGMPPDAMWGDRLHSPAVNVRSGVAWVRWSVDPEECDSFSSDSVAVDHSLWERAKLSEYYAARELAGTEAVSA